MNKGLTLIEILLAMGLASVVFVLVGSILALFVTQNTKSMRQERFEQVKNDLVQELSNNVRWGKIITYTGGRLEVDGNQYWLEAGRLVKDGESLVPENIEVTNFLVNNRTTADNLYGAEIRIDLRDRSYNLAQDVVKITVSQRITEID